MTPSLHFSLFAHLCSEDDWHGNLTNQRQVLRMLTNERLHIYFSLFPHLCGEDDWPGVEAEADSLAPHLPLPHTGQALTNQKTVLGKGDD